MQLIDNLPHSHHIAPISSASLINHKSTDVSSNLSSSAQCGSQSDGSFILSLFVFVYLLPLLSIAPSGKVCIKSDSRVSIIVLLSLLQDKPFTCANRCQGHFISTTGNNVGSTSQSPFKCETGLYVDISTLNDRDVFKFHAPIMP